MYLRVFRLVRRASFCEGSQLKSMELAILLAVCSSVCVWPVAQSVLTPSAVWGNKKRPVCRWTAVFFLIVYFLFSSPSLSHCAATCGCSCFSADVKNNNRWAVINTKKAEALYACWVLRSNNLLTLLLQVDLLSVRSNTCLCCDF